MPIIVMSWWQSAVPQACVRGAANYSSIAGVGFCRDGCYTDWFRGRNEILLAEGPRCVVVVDHSWPPSPTSIRASFFV